MKAQRRGKAPGKQRPTICYDANEATMAPLFFVPLLCHTAALTFQDLSKTSHLELGLLLRPAVRRISGGVLPGGGELVDELTHPF